MTMRVTVKNEDLHRTAVVTQVSPSGARSETTTTIEPAQSAEFWIHSGMSVEVSEGVSR